MPADCPGLRKEAARMTVAPRLADSRAASDEENRQNRVCRGLKKRCWMNCRGFFYHGFRHVKDIGRRMVARYREIY